MTPRQTRVLVHAFRLIRAKTDQAEAFAKRQIASHDRDSEKTWELEMARHIDELLETTQLLQKSFGDSIAAANVMTSLTSK